MSNTATNIEWSVNFCTLCSKEMSGSHVIVTDSDGDKYHSACIDKLLSETS